MRTHRFSRHKVSRRLGFDVYGTGGDSLDRRMGTPPGGFKSGGPGRGRRSKATEYALRLVEKQKVRAVYNLRERQFRRYVAKARASKAHTGRVLLELIERRLDNIVYRLGFARTRMMARQLVRHGHVRVDGKRVNIPSFLVKPGQTVALTPEALKIPDVQSEMEVRRPGLSWLALEDGVGRLVAWPNRDELREPIDETLVVEFYSR